MESFSELDKSIVETEVSENSIWLRIDRHAFKSPFGSDEDPVVHNRCENYSIQRTIMESDRLNSKSQIFKNLYSMFESILIVKPDMSLKDMLQNDFYDTDHPDNVNSNVEFQGQGPCERRKFKHIIACLKDYLAAYRPIVSKEGKLCDTARDSRKRALHFAVSLSSTKSKAKHIKEWLRSAKHSNFIDAIQVRSKQFETNWYGKKFLRKIRIVLKNQLSTPKDKVDPKKLKSLMDSREMLETKKKKVSKKQQMTPEFDFSSVHRTTQNTNSKHTNDIRDTFLTKNLRGTNTTINLNDPNPITHINGNPQGHSQTTLDRIDSNLQQNLANSRQINNRSFGMRSDELERKTDHSESDYDGIRLPSNQPSPSLIPQKRYKDSLRANNDTLLEFHDSLRRNDSDHLQRNTLIVSRDNHQLAQRQVNQNNRSFAKTHSNTFVTTRTVSKDWQTVNIDDSNQQNTSPMSLEKQLLSMCAIEVVDQDLIDHVESKIRSSNLPSSSVNSIVTTMLRGLTLTDIQNGASSYIFKKFPKFESLEFCVLRDNSVSTTSNWSKEEVKQYQELFKTHTNVKKLTYADVKYNIKFSLQAELQKYYHEYECLLRMNFNTGILCKWFVENCIDKRLHTYIYSHTLNMNYDPNNFKYVIERLYCLETQKIATKTEHKYRKLVNWQNEKKLPYDKYIDSFLRINRRLNELFILQNRLNEVQKRHLNSYRPVRLNIVYPLHTHQIICRFLLGLVNRKLKQKVISKIRKDIKENAKLNQLPVIFENDSFSIEIDDTLPLIPGNFRILRYLSDVIQTEAKNLLVNDLKPIKTFSSTPKSKFSKHRGRDSNRRRNSSNFKKFSQSGKKKTKFRSKSTSSSKKSNFKGSPKTRSKSSTKYKKSNFGKKKSWNTTKYTKNKFSKSNKNSNFSQTKWKKPNYKHPKFSNLKSSNRHNSFKNNKSKHLKNASMIVEPAEQTVSDVENPKSDTEETVNSVLTSDVKQNLAVRFSDNENEEGTDVEPKFVEENEEQDGPHSSQEDEESVHSEKEGFDESQSEIEDYESEQSSFQQSEDENDFHGQSDSHSDDYEYSCTIQKVESCAVAQHIVPNKAIPQSLRDTNFKGLPPNIIEYRKLCQKLGGKHKISSHKNTEKCKVCGSTDPKHRPSLCGQLKNITSEQDKSRIKTLSVSCFTINSPQEEKIDSPTPINTSEKSQSDKIGTLHFIVSDFRLNVLAWTSLHRLFNAKPNGDHQLIIDFDRPGEFSCPSLGWKLMATDEFTAKMRWGLVDQKLIDFNDNRWSLEIHFDLAKAFVAQCKKLPFNPINYVGETQISQRLTPQFTHWILKKMEILQRNPHLLSPEFQGDKIQARSVTPPLDSLKKKFIVEILHLTDKPTPEPETEMKNDPITVSDEEIFGLPKNKNSPKNFGGQGVSVIAGCTNCDSECKHNEPTQSDTTNTVKEIMNELAEVDKIDTEKTSNCSDSESLVYLLNNTNTDNESKNSSEMTPNDRNDFGKNSEFKSKFMYFAPRDSHHNFNKSNCKHERYHHKHINSHNMEHSKIYRDSLHLQDCVVHLHLSEKCVESARKLYKNDSPKRNRFLKKLRKPKYYHARPKVTDKNSKMKNRTNKTNSKSIWIKTNKKLKKFVRNRIKRTKAAKRRTLNWSPMTKKEINDFLDNIYNLRKVELKLSNNPFQSGLTEMFTLPYEVPDRVWTPNMESIGMVVKDAILTSCIQTPPQYPNYVFIDKKVDSLKTYPKQLRQKLKKDHGLKTPKPTMLCEITDCDEKETLSGLYSPVFYEQKKLVHTFSHKNSLSMTRLQHVAEEYMHACNLKQHAWYRHQLKIVYKDPSTAGLIPIWTIMHKFLTRSGILTPTVHPMAKYCHEEIQNSDLNRITNLNVMTTLHNNTLALAQLLTFNSLSESVPIVKSFLSHIITHVLNHTISEFLTDSWEIGELDANRTKILQNLNLSTLMTDFVPNKFVRMFPELHTIASHGLLPFYTNLTNHYCIDAANLVIMSYNYEIYKARISAIVSVMSTAKFLLCPKFTQDKFCKAFLTVVGEMIDSKLSIEAADRLMNLYCYTKAGNVPYVVALPASVRNAIEKYRTPHRNSYSMTIKEKSKQFFPKSKFHRPVAYPNNTENSFKTPNQQKPKTNISTHGAPEDVEMNGNIQPVGKDKNEKFSKSSLVEFLGENHENPNDKFLHANDKIHRFAKTKNSNSHSFTFSNFSFTREPSVTNNSNYRTAKIDKEALSDISMPQTPPKSDVARKFKDEFSHCFKKTQQRFESCRSEPVATEKEIQEFIKTLYKCKSKVGFTLPVEEALKYWDFIVMKSICNGIIRHRRHKIPKWFEKLGKKYRCMIKFGLSYDGVEKFRQWVIDNFDGFISDVEVVETPSQIVARYDKKLSAEALAEIKEFLDFDKVLRMPTHRRTIRSKKKLNNKRRKEASVRRKIKFNKKSKDRLKSPKNGIKINSKVEVINHRGKMMKNIHQIQIQMLLSQQKIHHIAFLNIVMHEIIIQIKELKLKLV